jgi:histidine phosphotransfer protein HptB
MLLAMPNVQILDTETLARLEELDPTGVPPVLQRVLQTYDRALDRALRELESARAADDRLAVGRVAHTVRSSSASVGALGLSALCRQLEVDIRQGLIAPLAPRIETLAHEISRVQLAARDFMVSKGYDV